MKKIVFGLMLCVAGSAFGMQRGAIHQAKLSSLITRSFAVTSETCIGGKYMIKSDLEKLQERQTYLIEAKRRLNNVGATLFEAIQKFESYNWIVRPEDRYSDHESLPSIYWNRTRSLEKDLWAIFEATINEKRALDILIDENKTEIKLAQKKN